MFKNLRKSVIAFLVAVPALCVCGAITSAAISYTDGGGTVVVEAESDTVVTELGDVIRTFDGTTYYGPDISKYWVTKILDGDGVELDDVADGVTTVGEYTFYYTPNTYQGCVWADGSVDEKSYKVTINQATLLWKFIDRTTVVDVADAYTEVKYTESRTNYISKVYAECGNLSYNKSTDSSTNSVTIIKNGETTIKKNVIDAGTYTFTVAEEDIANYKNPTFTLKILPMEIDIGKSVNLNWTIDGVVNESLANGDVYCYTFNRRGSDKVECVYTTLKLSKAPFNNWENWTEDESGKAYLIEGIAAYNEDKTTKIKLYRDSGSLQLYNAVYSGDCSATESGKYVAKAVITPVDNYALTYTPSDTPKNMTITPLEDGAYEITKTWYIAYFVNEFLSQSSYDLQAKTEYTFPQKWTFGTLTEEITAPCLAHGDEVRMSLLVPDCYANLDSGNFNGYVLENATDHETILEIIGTDVIYREGMEEWESGEKDLVTFSITRDDGTTVCIDEPRSKLSYYVNNFMPVGKYTITFKAKNISINDKHLDWWNGNKGSSCGNEYFGITVSYNFEVTSQKLNYTDNLSFYNKQDKSPIGLNLSYLSNNLDAFFALAYDSIEYDAITKDDVLESQTYWSTVVDAFYGDRLEIRFKLKGADDDNYYSKDNVTVWNDRISKYAPGSYYLYYTVNLPNYISVPKEEDYEKYYFEVTVYEEVELPYLLLDTLQYTGESRTVQVAQTDHRYQIAGSTRTLRGEYKVTFTLSNPTLYRWKGVEGAVYELPWSIVDKPVNGWVADGELHIDDWFWNSFDRENQLITAKPVSGDPVFSISTDEGGQNLIEGLEEFTTDKAGNIPYLEGTYLAALPVGDYYLWAKIAETATHAPYNSTSYKFTVKAAENGWVSEPSLSNWKLGETPDLTAVNSASPIYGTVVYKIVSEFNQGQIYFDSASGLNKISEMPVGRYYLVATVEGDAACYNGIMFKQSVLVLSETSDENWIIQPQIANWKHGETPSDPIAMSVEAGSTIEFSYLTKSGKPLESQPTAIGDYILVAVAYSQDGTELARSQVTFKITGVDGALIALIVVMGVLLLLLGGIIIFIVVKRKRNKGGDNGGKNDGDEGSGDGGGTPTEGEENDRHEDDEKDDTPPNMPELMQNSEYNSPDQTEYISPDQTEQQVLITPMPTAKKVRSTAQKVRSQGAKPRSANAKVRAKKPDEGNQS
ncbi:MAG: hypothetical protein ACI4QN_02235 [Candidatus Coproplasma sp.]